MYLFNKSIRKTDTRSLVQSDSGEFREDTIPHYRDVFWKRVTHPGQWKAIFGHQDKILVDWMQFQKYHLWLRFFKLALFLKLRDSSADSGLSLGCNFWKKRTLWISTGCSEWKPEILTAIKAIRGKSKKDLVVKCIFIWSLLFVKSIWHLNYKLCYNLWWDMRISQ